MGFIGFVKMQHINANYKWTCVKISVPNCYDYENGVTY